jgi:hypothetical protein
MANYFNLTLDTTAPSVVAVKINDGAEYTTSRTVALAITCEDSSTTGYQMKIWGISGATTEADASWETFVASKTVELASGDGLKTVYVKIRDDVYNESASASATITLNTAVPSVTITGPDVTRISKMAGKNICTFSFSSDAPFTEYKVKVVPSISSLQDAGVDIGTTNGSTNMSGTGEYAASNTVTCTINGADLDAASSGDGQKIIKVFVKTEYGIWSV